MNNNKPTRLRRKLVPWQLIAGLMRDTTPEIDALLADLQIVEGMQAGLIAARARAANQNHQPAWLDDIAAIIADETQRIAEAIRRSERTS